MGKLLYRRREVVPLAIGVTLVASFGGYQVSPWGPWLGPILGGAVAGWFVGTWQAGSGAGGYAAGAGGFLFVLAQNWSLGVTAAVRRGLFLFVFFALVGLLVGAVFGFARSYRRGRRSEQAAGGDQEAADEGAGDDGAADAETVEGDAGEQVEAGDGRSE